MDKTYSDHLGKFDDSQDEGGIKPSDVLHIVDTVRTSSAIESFDGTASGGTGVALNRDNVGEWHYVNPDWESRIPTSAPDWFWIRQHMVASTAQRYSKIFGVLRPSVNNLGYVYSSTNSSLARAFVVQWSINGFASHSMHGGVGLYKGTNWPTGFKRADITPFDTGVDDHDEKFPFILKDQSIVVLSPGDELRFRMEYEGASRMTKTTYSLSGGSLTSVVTAAEDENPEDFTVTINQFVLNIYSLGPVDSNAEVVTHGGEVSPASAGQHYENYHLLSTVKAMGVAPNQDLV